MNTQLPKTLFLAMITSLSIACGDTVSGVGELGKVKYAISTDYVIDAGELRDVAIVTGHEQHFATSLTDKGEKKANSPGELTHRVRPSKGVEISTCCGGEDSIPSFDITVQKPGTYTIETMDDGKVFDYIELEFDSPTKLSLITWTRKEGDEEWTKHEGNKTLKVAAGSQATFLPIPMDADDNRLVGDVKTQLSGTPEGVIVEGENVYQVYEQRVVSSHSPVSIYFLEAADVTITLTDEIHDVKKSRSFEVQ
jgi:hypothetical protein